MKKIEIIVPVLNEFEVIQELLERLTKVKNKLENEDLSVSILLVDDGSEIEFKELLLKLKKNYEFKVIELFKNYGQQAALKVGIENTDAEAVILIDADLQDPPELIPDMVTLWKEGADVVHTVRNKREKESIFKKITANIFYRILSSNSNVNSTRNAGDFKLITKRIINIIKTTNEKQIYLRGLIDWYSVNSKVIFYDRKPRFAGKRKYKYKQSFELALNGLITYSDFLQNFLARVFLFFIILLLLLIIFLAANPNTTTNTKQKRYVA